MVLVPKKKKLLKKKLSNNSAAKQKPTAGAPASKKVVPTPQKKKAAPLPKSEKPLGKPIEKPTAFSGISLLRGIKAKALVEEKDIQFDSEDEDSSSGSEVEIEEEIEVTDSEEEEEEDRWEDEVEELVETQTIEMKKLLVEIKEALHKTRQNIVSMQNEADKGNYEGIQGITHLDVKNHVLISYLTSLTQFILCKLKGEKIEDSEVVDILIRDRVTLEKLRPIDTKLKYQIEKLLRISKAGVSTGADGTQFAPRPEDLVSKMEDDAEDDEEKTGEKAVYKAPRLRSAHFDDASEMQKAIKEEERLRKKAAKSQLVKDVQSEFTNRPEESAVIGGQLEKNVKGRYKKLLEEQKERQQHEEDYFIRLATSKKKQKQLKHAHTHAYESLHDLTNFSGFGALNDHKDKKSKASLLRQQDVSRNEDFKGEGKKKRRRR